MSDVDWTQDKTDKAVALWIAGGDVVSIATELGATPTEVMARIAQAAANQTAAPPADASAAAPTAKLAAEPAAKAGNSPDKMSPNRDIADKASAAEAAPKPAAKPVAAKPVAAKPVAAKPVAAKPKAAGKPDAGKPVAAASAPAKPAPVPAEPEPVLRVFPAPAGLAIAANDADPEVVPAAPSVPVAYDPTANHVPVRTSKRLLAASDGGEGVPFMKATAMECHFPLWADNEQVSIEVKRVCGCRVQTGKSWCAHHLQAVFEPPRKPQPRVA